MYKGIQVNTYENIVTRHVQTYFPKLLSLFDKVGTSFPPLHNLTHFPFVGNKILLLWLCHYIPLVSAVFSLDELIAAYILSHEESCQTMSPLLTFCCQLKFQVADTPQPKKIVWRCPPQHRPNIVD